MVETLQPSLEPCQAQTRPSGFLSVGIPQKVDDAGASVLGSLRACDNAALRKLRDRGRTRCDNVGHWRHESAVGLSRQRGFESRPWTLESGLFGIKGGIPLPQMLETLETSKPPNDMNDLSGFQSFCGLETLETATEHPTNRLRKVQK
jgi:hypothetical protein